jgi:hypothetical protein
LIRSSSSFREGLTLVELLIVTVLSMIVAGICFSIYRLNSANYLREESYIQQQQNLRAALYILGRDLRSAGNGFYILGNSTQLIQAYVPAQMAVNGSGVPYVNATSGWFKNPDSSDPGFRVIYGIDGGPDRPDSVTIFKSELEFASPIGVVADYAYNVMTLRDEIIPGTMAKGDIIAIVNNSDSIILEVKDFTEASGIIEFVTDGRFTPSSGIPSSFTVPGSTVYNFRDIALITYYIDEANSRLMAIYHDHGRTAYDNVPTKSAVVANNIEDMQLFYFFDHDVVDLERVTEEPLMSSDRLRTESVKAVALALTSRSRYDDPELRAVRPALYNRSAGTTPDGNRRNTLSELIFLRNYQQ